MKRHMYIVLVRVHSQPAPARVFTVLIRPIKAVRIVLAHYILVCFSVLPNERQLSIPLKNVYRNFYNSVHLSFFASTAFAWRHIKYSIVIANGQG